MKKAELINFLKVPFPNETKIYEITEKSVRLAGLELDVSDCVDEYWGRIFSKWWTPRIISVGELREYASQGRLPFLYMSSYTPLSIVKFFIERLTNETFSSEKIFLIRWELLKLRMSKEEIEVAIVKEEQIKEEEKSLRNSIVCTKKKLLSDTNNLEVLEQQLDMLERALQGYQSQIEFLNYRLKIVSEEWKLNENSWKPEELIKEIKQEKIRCEQWINKLQNQIKSRQSKINLIREKIRDQLEAKIEVNYPTKFK